MNDARNSIVRDEKPKPSQHQYPEESLHFDIKHLAEEYVASDPEDDHAVAGNVEVEAERSVMVGAGE